MEKINLEKTQLDNDNEKNVNIIYASNLKRFLAFFIDNIIMFIILFPLIMIMSDTKSIPSSQELNVLQIIFIPIILFMWVKWGGATPGKKIMKIKIVDENSFGSLTGGQAILRYIGYIPSSIMFIGFIMILFTKKKQGLHDKIAKTVVIEER